MGLVFAVLWIVFIVGILIYTTQIAPKIDERKRQEEIERRRKELETLRREKIIEISREQRRRHLKSGVNKKGIDGELRVRSELDKLKAKFYVFHNITIADANLYFRSFTNTEINKLITSLSGMEACMSLKRKTIRV